MSSIRSVLIRSCMANIQKEISQLEHWLINLPEDTPTIFPTPVQAASEERSSFEQSNLFRFIEALSSQISKQEDTLNNILERLDSIEGGRNSQHEVYIKEESDKNRDDPWIDNQCEPLQNEIIGEGDSISEPLYIIKKNTGSSQSSVATPSIIPNIPEDKSAVPDIVSECSSQVLDADLEASLVNSSKVKEEEEVEEEEVEEEEEKEEEVEEEV